MKVVFCDVDNVLNSEYHTKKNGDCREDIEELKVRNLKKIVDAAGAEVVIVSHAHAFNDERFAKQRIEQIRKYGVNPIADLKSGGFLGPKDDAVKRWLNEHKEVEKFVIFDDGYDNYYDLVDHLILVDYHHGLTYKHTRKAIEMLDD